MRACAIAILLSVTAPATPAALAQSLRGDIKVDGSSTVYLITEAIASNFKRLNPLANITVGISGTGGGFKKFAAGETDLQDASRKIKPAEDEACKKNGIDYLELQVAWDGLAVIVNKENTWASRMTVEQLKKIWHPDSAARRWSDVEPSWPQEPIELYGPGPDSGTFDYFTEAINGKEKVTRRDYTASEDDNTLIQGVSRNNYALGYFGLAYYEANRDRLVAVEIAAKSGAPFVAPSASSVLKQTYKPLSRPLFVYVKTSSLERLEVREFMKFYLRRTDLVEEAKYVPLSTRQWFTQTSRLESAVARNDARNR